METISITDRELKRLQNVAQAQQVEFRDKSLPGFRVRVGRRISYCVVRKIASRFVRFTFGNWPELSARQARAIACDLLAQMRRGVNPHEAAREQEIKEIGEAFEDPTLLKAYEHYREIKALKPRTLIDYATAIERLEDWHALPLSKITPVMVMKRFTQLSKKHGKAQANLTMRFLRAVFNFHDFEDGKNPVKRGLTKKKLWHKIAPKERFLYEDQMKVWFDAVQKVCAPKKFGGHSAETIKDYLVLILFTGLREEEAQGLLWKNVDFKHRKFTVRETKNGTDHTLPLTSFIEKMLGRRFAQCKTPYVFADRFNHGPLKDPSKRLEEISKECGFPITEHDLRRTFSTHGEELMSFTVISHILNHNLPCSRTTALYIKKRFNKMRQGLEAWEAYLLDRILDSPMDNVVKVEFG